MKAGSADLPLHAAASRLVGAAHDPARGDDHWVQHYGGDEFLSRLAHPFWFQSFGVLMGLGWYSSGITTSVIGALKRG